MGNEKIYQILQDQIIELLDKGVVPWKRTFSVPGGFAKNIVSNKMYRGFNYMMLNCQSQFNSPYWMTFKQCKDLGGTIKKGERSTVVTFWKTLKKEDKETGEENIFPMIRYYRVFNLDQTEGVKVPKRDMEDTKYNNHPIENCEMIIREYKTMPEVVWGKAPCYMPSSDKIGMPEITNFTGAAEYYSTFFHEMGHSTMHMTRLDRKGLSYAKEELVAEMTACFLCGTAGIETSVIENQAAYIASWKKRIKEEPKIVVSASSAAQKASDFILNITELSKQKEEADRKRKAA